MKKLTMAALVSTAMATSGLANAGPIALTSGYGITNFFNALGATNLPVTSVYTNDGSISAGTEATDLAGKILAFNDSGSGVIDTLDPLSSGSAETANYGFGTGNDWYLDFSYNLSGAALFQDGIPGLPATADGTMDGFNNTSFAPGADGLIDPIDAIIPSFQTGVFEFFYRDNNNSANDAKVLELKLTGSELAGAGVVLKAEVDWSWYTGGNSFVENFFIDQLTGLSFYDASQQTPDPFPVYFRTDFNVDPNYMPTCVDAACLTLERSTDLNISATFNVPAPSSIALLGLGLLGLGAAARRKA